MTHDQPAADRERIAGEMCKAQPGRWWVADEFHELGNAVRAFEVLCDAALAWELYLDPINGWHAKNAADDWDAILAAEPPTRNHAADVCRLVCEVLDREAPKIPDNQG